MKKSLAVTSAFAVLLVMLLSAVSLLGVSAEADLSRWLAGGEKNVTVNGDGTVNVAQFSSAVLKEYIDVNDANLDVSVKMAIPFANADQFVSVILTKDPTDVNLSSANTIAHRFGLYGEKYGLNNSYLNGTEFPLYAGGYIPTENGEVTIRIKNDNGIIRLYMDDACIISGAEYEQAYSDIVKAMGGAYLGVYVTSGAGPITAKILEVNGKNPTAAKAYAASDWLLGGEKNVTANEDGTVNVPQFSSAVLKEYIDLTDASLDVSVKMAIPFANTYQMVSIILTKNPTDVALDSTNVVAHRFALIDGKYGLNQSYLNGTAIGLFAGGYISTENGSVTIRIKNDNGTVRLYMDDTCIFYIEEHAATYSDIVKAMGGAHLGISVSSGEGPITANILEVNGKNPTGVVSAPEPEPEPDLPPVVDETDGEYKAEDWVISETGVSVNADGTANIAVNGTAVLNRMIDLTAEDLDVSVKLAIPFANASQFVTVLLTKDTADVSPDSANVIAHRFALDGENYGLNQTYLNGAGTGAYAGGYIPAENGEVTIRIKNDNGTIRLYMDDTRIFTGDDAATIYSDAVKAMRGAYLGVTVTSFEGMFTAQLLEINGKKPVTLEQEPEPDPELPPVVDETDGEYTAEDWVISETGISVNADGTANIAVNGTAVLNRMIDLTAEDLDVSVKLALPFVNASQLVSVVLTQDTGVVSQDSEKTIVHRFALDDEEYGLNQTYLNGVGTGAYSGGYIPAENGEVTIRIKNDNGTVRLYMDDTCIFSGDAEAAIYSDAVKAMRGAYLGVTVTSFEGMFTAQLLEINGKKPVTVEVKEPATKDEWENTGADFKADGSIALGDGDFASLDRVIDMNDPKLDLKWVVNVKELPHVENADKANFCFYFYNPLTDTAPEIVEGNTAELYRPRFFIDDMDVLYYSEAFYGGKIDMRWGQTDLADYFMWEGDYDVEFRLYNDNGLLRLTANGKQIIPDDTVMKEHSDYLKQCGEVYFGMSVSGNAEVTLKSFDGAAAYDGKDAGSNSSDSNNSGSPDTGDASVSVIPVMLAVALAAVYCCVLTMKKRADF